MMKIRFSNVEAGIHPVLGKVFHRRVDAIGPEADRYQRYLASTLSGVAPDVGESDRLLELIEKLETKAVDEALWEGQDITLTFRGSEVQVDIDVNDDWIGNPEGKFSLQELKRAVTGWRSFIAQPDMEKSAVEVNLAP
jgi:hypothetical protein